MRAFVLTGFLWALAAPTAHAQRCVDDYCVRKPPKRGTHFILELNAGSSTYGSGGLAIGGLFGIGGKLRGFPLVFYLFAETAYHTSAHTISIPLDGRYHRDDRAFRDLVFGVRMYLPIWGPLRLFADAAGGASYVTTNLERDSARSMISADGWAKTFQVSVGAQVRIFRNLSLGLRWKAMFTDEEAVPDAYALIGDELPLRSMATANITWHF
jgi:hypothetical protein